MKRFTGIVSDHDIREAISDLEELGEGVHAISVAAIPYGAKSRPTLLSGRHRPALGSFLAPYGLRKAGL